MDIGIVKPITIEDEMRNSYIDYAMSVIVSRALPDVRDGLKPVHRRILYGMHGMGLRHSGPFRKSAKIVGEVMGNFHPHGDAAIYDTMVRMAQDFSMRYLLVDGQGNFGSVDGDPPAAMRYTEARLSALAEEMLADIDKNTVDFVPNYDGSIQEPSVLPSKLPNLLLNGAAGIAVGMATNVPPHNLTELCDATAHLIDNPEATVDDLVKLLPGPDFPTGGIILGREGINTAYATGKGRVVVRAKAHFEEAPRGGRFIILVTELPYQVNKAGLIEKIASLVKDDKIDGISDLRDESDRTGMRIVIELKRDAHPRKVLNQLFKFTAMQTTFGVNMLALVDGTQPRVLTLKRILQHYIDYRHEVLTRRTRFELDKAKQRAHILEGLKIALDNLDAVIRTIRESRTADNARTNLMKNFQLSEAQATAILDMQLRRLAALERKKIEDEYAQVLKLIAYLEDLLANPKKIFNIIKADLQELKEKYGDQRRTLIVEQEAQDFSDQDLIPDVETLITLTDRGYIKRVPPDTYRPQRRGGKGITGVVTREADAVQHLLACRTLDSILFFTNKGRVFQLKAHEVPDYGRTAKGLPLINLISLSPDELVTEVLAVTDFAKAEYLVIATRNGKIKRTPLEEYSAVRSNGLIAINLEDSDELAGVRMTAGGQDVILATANGQAIRFSEEDARPMGRATTGVNAIKLAKGDGVVSLEVVRPDSALFTVTKLGVGKRTPFSDYPVQGRAGGGVRNIKVSERSGPVATARTVHEKDDLMLVSTGGLVIRTTARGVPLQGRGAQGVSLMTVKKTDVVASVAVIDGSTEERPAMGAAEMNASHEARTRGGAPAQAKEKPATKNAAKAGTAPASKTKKTDK